jgi:membrane protein CcdC involved in cytochrome C biogenesis
MHWQTLFGSVASLAGAAAIIAWRVHETRHEVKLRGIILPPLGMSTGFAMFAAPQMRIPFLWGLGAFLVGAGIFAIPLAHTSKLHRDGDIIVMRRSPAFLAILLVLVAIRFALRSYIDQFISPLETGALFFVLAFGMILRWRIGMLLEYRRLTTATGSIDPDAFSQPG